jgi:hypothetical protein
MILYFFFIYLKDIQWFIPINILQKSTSIFVVNKLKNSKKKITRKSFLWYLRKCLNGKMHELAPYWAGKTIIKHVSKYKNSKWWLNPRWRQKNYYQFKISKMTILLKKTLSLYFLIKITTFIKQFFFF